MKTGIRKVAELGVALTAIATLVLAGCGGGGGGGSSSGGGGSGGATASLTSSLAPVLQIGNVVTAQFQRRDQSTISNVAVAYSLSTTGAPGFSDAKINVTTGTIAAGATTGYSTALPAGTFNMQLGNPGFVAGGVGGLNAVAGTAAVSSVNAVAGNLFPEIIPVAVTNTSVTNYRAEEYQWTITTPAASAVQVTVVQVDPATGKADVGTGKIVASPLSAGGGYWTTDSRTPLVVTAASSVATGGITSVQLNTELLPGNYKAYVTATNASGVVAATYISPSVFTSTSTTAATGTPKNMPITLTAGKAVSLTLQNNAGTAIAGRRVDFFDGATLLNIGGATTDATGTASIAVESATTTVLAQVYTGAVVGAIDAMYTFSNVAAGGASVTLKQQTVTGAVQPNASCALTPLAGATTIGSIKVAYPSNPSLSLPNDVPLAASATVATNGAYSLTVFGPTAGTGISYNLSAIGTVVGSPGVDGCSDVAVTPVTVAAAAVTQNLAAAGGGTIIGKVSTKAGAAVSGLTIDVWQTSANGSKKIATTTTNASGNYQIAVPYGTYTLWAGSSIAPLTGWSATEGVVVSAAAQNVSKNLTKFTLTMQVAKSLGTGQSASINPTVNVGGLSVPASNLGVASVDIMEGNTWFCARPGATEASYSYLCNLNVLVDLNSVTAAGQ